MKEQAIQNLFAKNRECRQLLTIIEALQLPDCWLCAGYLRNYLWGFLSGKIAEVPITDIDVVFYDPTVSVEETAAIEAQLRRSFPEFPWEVRNQALMHQHNFAEEPSYTSTFDALTKFPERRTAVAARMKQGEIELMAPFGWQDVCSFRVRPTPHFAQNDQYLAVYRQRQAMKQWQKVWPQLLIEEIDN
ncbi:nucleotidyltransferase family protein [Enterococcus casseliflavus]|nr:nucleotidyltransferase family protein [Enterococcus casseliflavus]